MELNCAPDECAGDGDALLLPARQLRAPLAHHGVQLLGQLLDEVERVGLSGGRFNYVAPLWSHGFVVSKVDFDG